MSLVAGVVVPPLVPLLADYNYPDHGPFEDPDSLQVYTTLRVIYAISSMYCFSKLLFLLSK